MLKLASRILLLLLFVIAAAIGLVVALEPTIDLAPYRDFISRHASASIGRAVTVDGDIQLTLGRHVRARIGSLQVDNPDWAESPHLLAAKDLDIGVDLLALALGVVHVEAFRAHDVVAATEQTEDGRQSWDFEKGQAPPAKPATRGNRIRWVIEEADVKGLEFSHRDPTRLEPLVLAVDRIQQRADGDDMVLGVNGVVNKNPLQLNGRVGTLEGLLEGRDVQIELDASLGKARFKLAGVVGDFQELEGIDLQASLHSPDLAALIADLGFVHPIRGGADLILQVDGGDPGLVWTAKGNLGEHQIDLTGAVEKPLALDGINARFDISGPDLAALAQLAGLTTVSGESYRLTGTVRHVSPMLAFEQVELRSGMSSVSLHGMLPEFPSVNNASLELDLSIEDASVISNLFKDVPRLDGPLSLEISVQTPSDEKTLIDANAEWSGNRASLKGPLGRHPYYAGSALHFAVSGPELEALLELAAIESPIGGAFQLIGDLEVDAKGLVELQINEGRLGETGIDGYGTLGRMPRLEDLDLVIGLRGQSFAVALAPFTDISLPRRPFAIDVRLTGSADAFILRDIDARVGDTRLQTQGRVAVLAPFKDTDATFELFLPTLADWLPAQASATWATQAYRVNGRLRKTGRTLRLMDVSVDGGDMSWQLDASVGEDLALSKATLNAKTKGEDARNFLPDIPGYRPVRRPFDISFKLDGGREKLTVRNLRIRWAGAELLATGSIAMEDPLIGSSIDVDLNVARLSDLGDIDGVVLPDQPLKLTTQLLTVRNGLRVPKFDVNVSGGNIKGSFLFRKEPRTRLEMDATMQGIDFQPFIEKTSAKQNVKAKLNAQLIPDRTLPFAILRDLEAELQLRGEALHYPDPGFPGKTLVRDLEIDATLEQGVLSIRKLNVDGDHGDVAANAIIDASGSISSVELALESQAFRFGLLAAAEGLEALPTNEIKLQFDGQGESPRDIAATANGALRIVGGSGQTTNIGLDRKLGDFGYELLSTINPFTTREPNTQIECLAVALMINEGMLQMQPGLAMRTDRVDISASGSIDLSTEAIDLQFSNAARRGLGVSLAGLVRPFISIGGHLASPRLAVDTSGALVSGAAAVATAGVSILVTKLLDRASTATDPCQRLIAAADEERGLRSMNPLDSLSAKLRRSSVQASSRQTR